MPTLKSSVVEPPACEASLGGWHHKVSTGGCICHGTIPAKGWNGRPASHISFCSCSSHADTRWRCRPSVTLAALCQFSAWLPHWSPLQYFRESPSPCVPRKSRNLLEISVYSVIWGIPLSVFEDPGGVCVCPHACIPALLVGVQM